MCEIIYSFLIFQESVKTFITAKKRIVLDDQTDNEVTRPLVEGEENC